MIHKFSFKSAWIGEFITKKHQKKTTQFKTTACQVKLTFNFELFFVWIIYTHMNTTSTLHPPSSIADICLQTSAIRWYLLFSRSCCCCLFQLKPQIGIRYVCVWVCAARTCVCVRLYTHTRTPTSTCRSVGCVSLLCRFSFVSFVAFDYTTYALALGCVSVCVCVYASICINITIHPKICVLFIRKQQQQRQNNNKRRRRQLQNVSVCFLGIENLCTRIDIVCEWFICVWVVKPMCTWPS